VEGHAVVDVMNKFLLGALALLVCGFTVVLWLLARRSKAVAATPPSGPLTCPVCGAVLSEKDVWLGKIPCQKCGRAYRLECLRPAASVAGLSNPPWGARLEILADGFTAVASMRSGLGFLAVPAALFIAWGLIKVLPAVAAGAPIAGPAVLILTAALLVVGSLHLLLGQLRITRHGDRLTVFCGLGPMGFTSGYPWSSFRKVYEQATYNNGPILVLDGEFRVTFGSLLSLSQRDFLLQALRAMLAESQGSATAAMEPLANTSEYTADGR